MINPNYPALRAQACHASQTLNRLTIALVLAACIAVPLSTQAHTCKLAGDAFAGASVIADAALRPPMSAVVAMQGHKAVIAKDHPKPQRKPTPPHKLTINELAER